MGKIDNVFKTGLVTKEDLATSSKFHETFRDESSFEGRTLIFGRTKIHHLPADQYELTREPTEFRDGRMRIQDTPPKDAVSLFDIDTIDDDTEIIIIPPCQTSIDDYVEAIEERFCKKPHIAFWTVTRFADNVGWRVAEFRGGMPNLMGMEDGAL